MIQSEYPNPRAWRLRRPAMLAFTPLMKAPGKESASRGTEKASAGGTVKAGGKAHISYLT
jgi:hypothetical protein